MPMSTSEAPGIVTVYPQNNIFFVKGFTSSGKKKQGGFLGTIYKNDGHLARLNEIPRYAKLSNELNNANIVNVDLYVLFLNDEKSYQGRGAKLTVKTNLHLAANEHYKGVKKKHLYFI